jgi:hypothetical protein
MDMITLIALALFVILTAAWIILPAKGETGVSDQDEATAGALVSQS